MIAGNDGDPLRIAQPRKPRRGLAKFVRKAEVREIAGDGDVVEVFRLHVEPQRVEHVAPVLVAAFAPPRHVAENPLAEQRAHPDAGERGQVQVGQMRQREIGVRRRCVVLVRVDFQL